MTIYLDQNAIHLWMTSFDQIDDENLLRRYQTLLSDEEREQQRRFHFEIDRRCYLVARALVRSVLSRYEPVAPRDWQFTANAYGRPEIAAVHGEAARLRFNISHTNSLILMGVACQRWLGVDVENDRLREAPVDAALSYFAEREVQDLYALPPTRQKERFFEYWTLKESYIKARGRGLSIPLDRFSFDFPSDQHVRLSVDESLSDSASRWWVWQFRLLDDYIGAVCSERDSETIPQLLLRHVIPLDRERSVNLDCLRCSSELIRSF
ncbi:MULTISPECIES: 4'-phosphopantetheinyl transferase family protein [unclassified Bradyrhizobium]|uniref:4'-phosphopantetheinyl transferase family protein n=1 Tax=unclassified Bradyrhizobium TaxID=2631580 RepID=UPI0028F12BE9|nr:MULTISPECIES: 4'-phosphopantetheinyl transferase superfamily protein [unclassified Bradyrhizobium]